MKRTAPKRGGFFVRKIFGKGVDFFGFAVYNIYVIKKGKGVAKRLALKNQAVPLLAIVEKLINFDLGNVYE